MKDIIQKYFNDKLTADDFVEENIFYPPADLNTIVDVEKLLDIKLPQDYKDFLSISNGYNGTLGQSYTRLTKVEEIVENTNGYCKEFFPWAIHIGTDGGGEMYVLDTREKKIKYGAMPYIGEDKDFILLGDTFEEFARHLYYNDYWDK